MKEDLRLRRGADSPHFRFLCKKGHALSGENVKIGSTNGQRFCVACRKIAQKNFVQRERNKKARRSGNGY
jgi:hypothetical protein